MQLTNAQVFASPAEALEHHGVKGMKWGVRKDNSPAGAPSSEAQKAQRKSRAKKVLIGVGVLTAALGAAFLASEMQKNGDRSVSTLPKQTPKKKTEVEKVIQQPVSIIHLARGKTKGLRFQQEGGTPNYFTVWENTLGKHAHSSNVTIFEKHDGMIAARFPDPEGRRDRANRPIQHEVIVPKAMADGINNIEDLQKKVWPLLKDTYDPT